MEKLWNLIFAWFQRRCTHSPFWVHADILSGDELPHQVQWCQRCGAFRHFYDDRLVGSAWNEPRADWVDLRRAHKGGQP